MVPWHIREQCNKRELTASTTSDCVLSMSKWLQLSDRRNSRASHWISLGRTQHNSPYKTPRLLLDVCSGNSPNVQLLVINFQHNERNCWKLEINVNNSYSWPAKSLWMQSDIVLKALFLLSFDYKVMLFKRYPVKRYSSLNPQRFMSFTFGMNLQSQANYTPSIKHLRQSAQDPTVCTVPVVLCMTLQQNRDFKW